MPSSSSFPCHPNRLRPHTRAGIRPPPPAVVVPQTTLLQVSDFQLSPLSCAEEFNVVCAAEEGANVHVASPGEYLLHAFEGDAGEAMGEESNVGEPSGEEEEEGGTIGGGSRKRKRGTGALESGDERGGGDDDEGRVVKVGGGSSAQGAMFGLMSGEEQQGGLTSFAGSGAGMGSVQVFTGDGADIDRAVTGEGSSRRVGGCEAAVLGVEVPIRPWLKADGTLNRPFHRALVHRILDIIMMCPGISQRRIMDHMDILTPQNCLELLAVMERDGQLVVKERDQISKSMLPRALQTHRHHPPSLQVSTTRHYYVTLRAASLTST